MRATLPSMRAAGLSLGVVALAGVLFLGAVAVLSFRQQPGLQRATIEAVGLGLLAAIAVADLRSRCAPNQLVYPALAFVMAMPPFISWDVARDAWLGGALAFVVFAVLATARRGALGMGDVKTGTLCGLLVGLADVFPMLVLTFIGGGLLAAILLATRRVACTDAIPLTPFLTTATALVLLGT